jgi:hypothetical protein
MKDNFVLNPTVGFLGDSILYGYGLTGDHRCWRIFEKLSGMTVVQKNGENAMAFPGCGVNYINEQIDILIPTFKPHIIFLCIGANNFNENGRLSYPMGTTEDIFIKKVIAVLKKINHYGIQAIWLGLPPVELCGLTQAIPTRINNRINSECIIHGIRHTSFLAQMMLDDSWDAMGGKFYDNLRTDIHPNAAGNQIIANVCHEMIAGKEGDNCPERRFSF